MAFVTRKSLPATASTAQVVRRILLAGVLGLGLLFAGDAAAAKPIDLNITWFEVDEATGNKYLGGSSYRNVDRGSLDLLWGYTVFDATAEEMYRIFTDFGKYSAWNGNQIRSEIQSSEGNVTIVTGETKVMFPIANRRYTLRMAHGKTMLAGERVYVVRWTQETPKADENLRAACGYWQIQPWGENNRYAMVKYVSYADSGIWVPFGIWKTEGRAILRRTFEGLRQHISTVYPNRERVPLATLSTEDDDGGTN